MFIDQCSAIKHVLLFATLQFNPNPRNFRRWNLVWVRKYGIIDIACDEQEIISMD